MMMADELELGKTGQTEKSLEILACGDVNQEAASAKKDEPDDLVNYLELKPEERRLGKKLCGYLNKLGGKGPLKGCKTRWFVFDQKSCHLYYFRTAQDSNPLGSMDLSKAAFNYCLEAEEGTFEITTPEKDYTLKAKNRQAMMYWLQQLQQKRWEYGENQNNLFTDNPNICTEQPESPPALKTEEEADQFLDPVKTPTGLVGVEAASLPVALQPTTLHNISLKHLGTEIQNFGSKAVFQFSGSKLFRENRTCFEEVSQGPNEMAEDLSQTKGGDLSVKDTQQEEQNTPFQKCSVGSLKSLTIRQTSTPMTPGKDTVTDEIAPDKATRLHNDVLGLTNELNAQRELVKLLHKALEAAQQEKRACNTYLSADESTRLELVRHKVRQIRDLENRACVLEKEKQELQQSLSMQTDLTGEMKQHAQLLMEKNHAKQEVILKLSQQMANESCLPETCDKITTEAIGKLEEQIVHLKDDQEAYKVQNKFLNSEIYQVTKLWQATADREKALALKCAALEAKYCQVESKYLTMLHKLEDNASKQDGTPQEMVKQLIADQSKREIQDKFGNQGGRFCKLAAIALLILREEEDAFWCLVAIIDCIMPEDYYSKTLTGSQVDQRVFKDFLSEKLPRLMSHFDQYNVDLSHITFNWFLVLFVDSLQSNILLQVWDAFLYEGTKVIFRYALAILKYNEEEILKLNDSLAIYNYLGCATQNISEGRKLMNIAFVEMNPFPLKLLQNRRTAHLEKLNAELSELERIREAYVKERVEQKVTIDGASEDEDETERNHPGALSPEFPAGVTSKS
ncbi:TBC1 domain family member 2A isoform X3 [Carcharodon carcharias]|uniref:TBC1 domain family member 2A isoform X3 n=1 Tax=Carcharodon carcharias TaxID=13397 RepID=UPI001B7EF72E|nr:TBC1 domain family member 2A isoform X3 [Carcharodon carcharias]